MSEMALPKPGSVLGQYPEREDERLGKLDQAVSVAIGWLRQRLIRGHFSAPLFLASVRRAEAAWRRVPAAERAAPLAQLKTDLRRAEAPSPALVAKSFALIRVTADERLRLRP